MKPIVLVGAGGHCRSVIEAARSINLEVAGALYIGKRPDDLTHVLDVPILGTEEDIPKLALQYSFVITMGAVGVPYDRIRLKNLIERCNGRFESIIASTAVVSRYAKIGSGSVVLHQAVVNANAKIGEHCIINTGAIIEHDAEVGSMTHVSTNVAINGAAKIGENCMVGSGSTILQCVNIASEIVIGAGAVITKSITNAGTYVGIPARKL